MDFPYKLLEFLIDVGPKGTLAPFRAFASGIFANCEEFHSYRSIRLLSLKILSPQAIESNQYVHQPLELSPESLISIDGSIESESKTRFAAAPDIVSFRRSSRVGKSLTSNHHEPSLLLQLDAVRAQAMLADVIEPENDQAGSKPSTDSPLRRATPSTRIRTAGGFHSPPAPRRNPLDTRDRVSQTSPRGPTSLSDRRPMSL